MDFLIGIGFGILAMLGFGLTDFFVAKMAKEVGAFKTAMWFQIVVLVLLITLSIFLFAYKVMTPDIILIIFITGAVYALSQISFAKGFEIGNISIVATIANAWGAFAAILGVIFLNEWITGLQELYIIMIILGTILVSLDLRNNKNRDFKKTKESIKYAILTLFSLGTSYFLFAFLSRAIGWFGAFLLITPVTIFFLLVYGGTAREDFKLNRKYFLSILLIAVFNIIATLSYNLGVTFNYTAIVAPISSASPVTTILLAILLLKEKLAKNQKVGIVIVLVGLILLST